MTGKQQADLGQQASRAFERDLPRLWAERPGQWVAYQGELLGFAKHTTRALSAVLPKRFDAREFCHLLH